MSSAFCFNLDQSKILWSGTWLRDLYIYRAGNGDIQAWKWSEVLDKVNVFFSKICTLECNTTSDWLNCMV